MDARFTELPDLPAPVARALAGLTIPLAHDSRPLLVIEPVVGPHAGEDVDDWRRRLEAVRRERPEAWLLAVAAPSAMQAAFDAGADEVVGTDVRPEEVTARLGRVLGRFEQLAALVRRFPSTAALFDRRGTHLAVSSAYRALFDGIDGPLAGRTLAEVVPGAASVESLRSPRLSTFVVELSPARSAAVRLHYLYVPVDGGGLAFVNVEPSTRGSARPDATEQARRLMTLGTASMGLAHDFNNLLTVVLGNTAFLKDEVAAAASNDAGHRLLRDLERAATRAGDLTEQILRYAGSIDRMAQPIDVNLLVSDLGPFLRNLIAPLAELRLELDDGHLEVEADAAGLNQILVNLVQNAAEATAEFRGEVVIRTGAELISEERSRRLHPRSALGGRRAIYVEVSDRGTGMGAATVAQAFEPFFSTRGHGRGLGLSVVRDVVTAHGGGIEVHSELGQGTRVSVWLPPSEEPTVRQAEPEPWTGRGLILVADDEPEVRGLLRRVLVAAGYQVLEAEDGDAAVELVETHPEARMIILDLTMPRLDGAEVARRLLAQGASLPILMMSGYAVSQVQARLANLEVGGFLKKPFLPGAVLAKVQRLLADTTE